MREINYAEAVRDRLWQQMKLDEKVQLSLDIPKSNFISINKSVRKMEMRVVSLM